jgi:hypothetical protein
MHHRFCMTMVVLFLAVSVAANRAHAQPKKHDAQALAQQLRDKARALSEHDRWSEACPNFEDSLRYDPTLITRLYLAKCYVKTGKLARAWELYREAVDEADRAGDQKRRDYAMRRAARLEPRLAVITIALPAHAPAGLVVTCDDRSVDTAALTKRIDPGTHVIVASAPGFESFRRTITLIAGHSETIAVPDLEASIADTPPRSATTRRDLALYAGSAGLASVATGFWFGWNARSAFSEAKRECGAGLVCGEDRKARADDLIVKARSNATTATVLVLTGGVAITIAAVVFLKSPPKRERAARIVPMLHDRGTGLAIMGRF